MLVDLPELVFIRQLELIMETTESLEAFIKARNERDFIFEKLRREVVNPTKKKKSKNKEK